MKLESYTKAIFLCLIGYIAFNLYVEYKRKDVNVKPIENKIEILSLEVDSLKMELTSKLDSIKVIEQTNNYYKNFYKEKENEINNIKNIDSLRGYIRTQLKKLGSPKF